MKSLIWKEWREIRFIPFAVTGFFVVGNLLWMFLAHLSLTNPASSLTYTPYAIGVLGLGAYLIAGILSGCGLFAGEIGSGSLAFLTMLPLSRSTIWLSKLMVGLRSIITSAVCVNVTAAAIYVGYETILRHRTQYFGHLDASSVVGLTSVNVILLPMVIGLLAAVGCFAVSMTVSMLVDRTLTGAVFAVIACGVLPALISGSIQEMTATWEGGASIVTPVTYLLLALVPPSFLAISYYVFLHGETMRSSKRFILAARALAVWAIVNIFLILMMAPKTHSIALTPPTLDIAHPSQPY